MVAKINLKLKAVIFDMDGVITNTMPDHYRAWKLALKGTRVPVTREHVYLREGQQGLKFVKEMFQLYENEQNPKRMKAVLRKKESSFKKIVKRRYITGTRSFLRYLHSKKIKLALVTGTSRHETHRILPKYISNLFDVIITGSDVKNGKPNPEPFRKAVQKLKVRPSEAVVIENAPFGIRSAKKAGLRCFALATSLPKNYLRGAEAVFPTIKALREKTNFKLN